MGSNLKKHFAGLDELRGIACLMVMLNHFSSYKSVYGIGDNYSRLLFLDWGSSGLTLFIVLSGFLITWLLFFEQSTEGNISIGKFYMRRILRIWPVYFVVIFLGHVVGVWATDFLDPQHTNAIIKQQYLGRTIFYVLLLPHITYTRFYPVSILIGHLWSIGIEEQFYWGWPWLVRLFKKRLVHIMILLIMLTFISEALYSYLDSHRELLALNNWISVVSKLNAFFYWSKAGYFAVGGLLAYGFMHMGNARKYICHPVCLAAGYAGAFVFTYWYSYIIASGMLLACSYTILVGNIIWRGSPFKGRTMQVLSFMGKISYGVYCFHALVLITILSCVQYGGIPIVGLLPNLALFSIGIAASILVATVSYYYLELPFLRFRSKYR
jgi:peptidoglycan/LPS O-acetylase OafA/YrhL